MSTRKRAQPKFLAVDFFCGAGGTTRGLIQAGGLVLAGLDNDLRCKKTYIANNKNRGGDGRRPQFLNYDLFPKTKAYPAGEQNVALEVLHTIIVKAKKDYPRTPLFFSICAPCQPFARLSKQEVTRLRLEKHVRDRSLLLQCLIFVESFLPDFVFCENVAGITSSEYGNVWTIFEKRLGKLGYKTAADVVDAVDFGVPQYRKRSIMLAIRKRKKHANSFSIPKVGAFTVPLKNSSARRRSVKDAIGDLPPLLPGERHSQIPNHNVRDLSPLNRRRLNSAKPGQTNVYMTDTRYGDLSLKCHQKVNERLQQRCFNDVYTRMHPDRPSPTITTRCLSVSNGRFGHFDVKQIRGISMREAALLQSFPRNYIFFPPGQLEPAARMIGNAVPPRLARFFARYLLSFITST